LEGNKTDQRSRNVARMYLPADSLVAFSDSVIAFKEEEEEVVEFFVGILAAERKNKKVRKKIR
jgi:hypothetical protein